MKKTLKIIFAFLFSILSILIISLFFILKPISEFGLRRAGYTAATVETAGADTGAITLKNIVLDDTSRIGTVSVSATASDILSRRLGTVTVQDAAITLRPGSGGGGGIPALPVRNLVLQRAVLTVETPLGPLPVKIDGELTERDANQQWNSTVSAETPFLTFDGKLTATIEPDRTVKAHLELGEAKFLGFGVDVKRLSGWISADIKPGELPVINAQLAAGIIKADAATFRDAAFTVSNTPEKTTIVLNVVAEGAGNITLDGMMDHVTHKGTLDFQAKVQKGVSLDASAKMAFEYIDKVLTFKGTATPKKDLPAIKISGSYKDGKADALLNLPAMDAGKIKDIFPAVDTYIQEATGTVGMTVRVKGSDTSGEVLLKTFSGKVKDNTFTDVNAVLKLDSLMPPVFKQQTISVGAITAGVPLTEGEVTISLDKNKNFTLHNAVWTVAKGKVTSSPFTMSLNDMTADVTLTATALELPELFALAPMEGLDATGTVNGVLPLHIKNGAASIENGTLETTGPGAIRYNPKIVPAFLQDTSKQQIVDLRVALKAFDYESLKLIVSGEMGKDQKISLQAKGKNPEFYGGHAVSLNFNVEGPLENVIRSNPGSNRIPDRIRKQMESYEAEHAK